MSRDTILKDEEGNLYSFDNLSTQRWLEGHLPGVELAVGLIRDRALKAFAAKKDTEAIALRNLADEILAELTPKVKLRAAEHEKNHPYELPKM